MKKRWLVLALALAVSLSGSALAAAEGPQTVTVTLNGFPLALEEPALLQDGVTLVPAEAFCAAVGGVLRGNDYDGGLLPGELRCFWSKDGDSTLKVEWKSYDKETSFTLNQGKTALFDGIFYVPLRPLAEALGLTVTWNGTAVLTSPKNRVEVDNLADLLNAVDSDIEIILKPGNYSYAELDWSQVDNPHLTGNDWVDGRDPAAGGQAEAYDVTISGVRDLTILGNGATLVTPWAYADVLKFENSNRLRLEGFTAVHDVEPGYCAGDCLELTNCADVVVVNCVLDGSGAYGLQGSNLRRMRLENTEIAHCTYGAASLWRCEDVRFESCRIHRCVDTFGLFSLGECAGVQVRGCDIEENSGGSLASFGERSRGVLFQDCRFRGNAFGVVSEYGWESSGGALLVDCLWDTEK